MHSQLKESPSVLLLLARLFSRLRRIHLLLRAFMPLLRPSLTKRSECRELLLIRLDCPRRLGLVRTSNLWHLASDVCGQVIALFTPSLA